MEIEYYRTIDFKYVETMFCLMISYKTKTEKIVLILLTICELTITLFVSIFFMMQIHIMLQNSFN
jgi:hypothetical protein